MTPRPLFCLIPAPKLPLLVNGAESNNQTNSACDYSKFTEAYKPLQE